MIVFRIMAAVAALVCGLDCGSSGKVYAQGFGNMGTGKSAVLPLAPFEKFFDDDGYSEANAVTVARDGTIFVTGAEGVPNIITEFEGRKQATHLYFGRFDNSGNKMKAGTYRPPGGLLETFAGAAIVEMTGGDFLIGANAPQADLNQPVLMRITADAQEVWKKPLNAPASQQIYKIIPFNKQYLVFATTLHLPTYRDLPRQTWVALVNDDGAIVGQSLFDGASTDATVAPEGGFLIVFAGAIARMSESGQEVSRTKIDWPGFRMVTTKDAIYLLGNTAYERGKPLKVQVARLDYGLREVWRRIYDVPGKQLANAGYGGELPDGDIVFTGGANTDLGSETIAMLHRIKPNGDLVWQREYGRGKGKNNGIGSRFSAVTVMPNGGVVVVGSSGNGVVIRQKSMDTRLAGDGWVMQVDPK